MSIPTSTGPRAVLALAAAISLALLAPASARAGAYRAAVCNPSLGARHADAAYVRSSPRYEPRAACGTGGIGLAVTHEIGETRTGGWGAWTIRAPRGTLISRAGLSATGHMAGGNLPELLARPVGHPLVRFASPGFRTKRFSWSSSPARALSARLRCRLASGCPRGRRATIQVRRASLRLADRVAPTLNAAGALFGTGSRRGLQTADLSGSDVGGGIRRLLIQVNGEPVAAHTVACRLAGSTAIRLSPCPQTASASFAAATASPPFHQGPNRVSVCAADFAATTAANQTCVRRRVRIDNLCPISHVAGARLRARFANGTRRLTLGPGRQAAVTGRLVSSAGQGVSGASVCIATRVRMSGATEQVVATPTTGRDGRFRVRLPNGASREVRVAHWASASSAIERYLDLRVRSRPRLSVLPHHQVHNGDRVRFAVSLPGPAHGARRARIQARAGGRWLNLRTGRSSPAGVYRSRYRFHATTGRRTYRFRATVPKQRGYPYESGRSRVKRVTVTG